MNSQRAISRLYLVTPILEDTSSFVSTLDAALDAGDIAAVLLRLADADEGGLTKRAKAVAAAVQRRDIALLLDGRSEMVGRAGADGAHITGIEAFAAAGECWGNVGSGVMMLTGGVEAAEGNSALVGLPVGTPGTRAATGPKAGGGAFQVGA